MALKYFENSLLIFFLLPAMFYFGVFYHIKYIEICGR